MTVLSIQNDTDSVGLSFERSSDKSFRIDCYEGCHGPQSPVIGTCFQELLRIYEAIKREPLLGQFEHAIYCEDNSPSFTFLIPLEQKSKADEISREIFLKKIASYTNKNETISESTIVQWSHLAYGPGSCIIKETPLRGYSIGWHICAQVKPKGSESFIREGKYLPPHLVAFHEIQHVEDTLPLVEASSWHKKFTKHGSELKETLKTQLLCDEVYKAVHDLGIYSEVDHGKSIVLKGHEIPIGKLVNFYRKLEESKGSLCEAILSSQSTEFLEKGGI